MRVANQLELITMRRPFFDATTSREIRKQARKIIWTMMIGYISLTLGVAVIILGRPALTSARDVAAGAGAPHEISASSRRADQVRILPKD
jgi:hypothetical protein